MSSSPRLSSSPVTRRSSPSSSSSSIGRNSNNIRRKRMLQSVGCVSGSPNRIPLHDDDDDDNVVIDNDSPRLSTKDSLRTASNGESTDIATTTPLSPTTTNANDAASIMTAGATPTAASATTSSARQFQVEEAMQSAIGYSNNSTSGTDSVAPTRSNQHDKESASFTLWRMQPSYDDAHVVFQSPSSDAGTASTTNNGSNSNNRGNSSSTPNKGNSKYRKVPLPAKPVVEDNGEAIVAAAAETNTLGEVSASKTTTGSYDDVEALIARVKRLDAVVQAGEEQEAAVTHHDDDKLVDVEATRPGPKHGDSRNTIVDLDVDVETSDSDSSNIERGTPPTDGRAQTDDSSIEESAAMISPTTTGASSEAIESPPIKPLQSSPHDSPSRLQTTNALTRNRDEGEAADNKHEQTHSIDSQPLHASPPTEATDDGFQHATDDGAQFFQVLYRRGDDEMQEHIPVRTSVATSSIVTMSSFGIAPLVRKSRRMIRPPPVRVSRSSQGVTAHAFFWRTHPKEIFTSYGPPNRPKTLLAPLNGEKAAVVMNPPESFNRKLMPNSSIASASQKMKTVEEAAEQKSNTAQDTSSRVRGPGSHHYVMQSPMLQKGAADCSPYGDDADVTRYSMQAAPLSPSTASSARLSSNSSSWVAFSEFSLGSADAFR